MDDKNDQGNYDDNDLTVLALGGRGHLDRKFAFNVPFDALRCDNDVSGRRDPGGEDGLE